MLYFRCCKSGVVSPGGQEYGRMQTAGHLDNTECVEQLYWYWHTTPPCYRLNGHDGNNNTADWQDSPHTLRR